MPGFPLLSLGTALGGLEQGYNQAQQQAQQRQQQELQRQALLSALQDKQRQQQAQGLAFQALLSGALGGQGNGPAGGLPAMGAPQPPPATPTPPMPGQASVPAPSAAASPLATGAPIMKQPLPEPNQAFTQPDEGAEIIPGESRYGVPAPAAAAPATAPAAPAPAADATPLPQPPPPQAATGLDLSRYFHQTDPQQIAQAIQKMRPDADPQAAMMAVEQLYKMGTQGSNLERAQTALVLNTLYHQQTLDQRERAHDTPSGTAIYNQTQIGERADKRETRIDARAADRTAAQAQTAALRRGDQTTARRLQAIRVQISTIKPQPDGTYSPEAQKQLDALAKEAATLGGQQQ